MARERPVPAWTVLADVLLRKAALVARVAFDHRPDPLAGLKIDDEDLEKLLTELPGFAIADHSVIRAIERETGPAVEEARSQLRSVIATTSGPEISGNNTFSRIVRFARLSELETEVLALACAVERDPRRQRIVGYLNDDVSQRRLSLFTLQLLFPEHPDVGLAISPGGGLRNAALLAPTEPGVLGSVALPPPPPCSGGWPATAPGTPSCPRGRNTSGRRRGRPARSGQKLARVLKKPRWSNKSRVLMSRGHRQQHETEKTGSYLCQGVINYAAGRPPLPAWGACWPRHCPHLRRPGMRSCAKPPSNKVVSWSNSKALYPPRPASALNRPATSTGRWPAPRSYLWTAYPP